MSTPNTTFKYSTYLKKNKDTHEFLFIKASKEIIDIQLRSGVSIPTDGEIWRENYIQYHCQHLNSFSFDNLV